MNDYESVVIFNPDLEEEQFEQSLSKVEGVIKKQGGKITDLQKWGLRSLAYEIQRHKQGNYVLLRFQCEPKAITSVERHYKLADPIIRFLTISIKPDQVQEAEKPDLLPEKEG